MQSEHFPSKNNVAIFVYWSQKNELSENTLSYIRELKKVSETVLFVSNSPVKSENIKIIESTGTHFYQRDNDGFDFWGWKEGISLLKDKISKANNLILCNSSCFLAFENFDKVLAKMNTEAELWGISSFENKNVPFHIQSYFMVFKKKILSDWDLFFSFWKNLPRMESWNDAVEHGELKLTQYYTKRGVVCRTISNRDLLPSTDVNPSIYYPIELFQNGQPLLKKKIFTENYKLHLHISNGNIPSSALSYVKEKKGKYSEILEELIKQVSPSQLLQTLHLNFFVTGKTEKRTSKSSTAVICFVYYDDMVDYISSVLGRFSGIGNIYIVSPKIELLESYRKFFDKTELNIEYRLQVNRGRNEAAYFLTCRDIWDRYDYVCALHDKKTSHAKPELLGIEFMKHCEQNLCPSSTSILEVINLFETNPLLGLLVPPLPFYGNFIFSAFNPLGQNLKSLQLINKIFFCGKLFTSKDEIDVFFSSFQEVCSGPELNLSNPYGVPH